MLSPAASNTFPATATLYPMCLVWAAGTSPCSMVGCASEQVAHADSLAEVRRCVVVQLAVHAGNPALQQQGVTRACEANTNSPYPFHAQRLFILAMTSTEYFTSSAKGLHRSRLSGQCHLAEPQHAGTSADGHVLGVPSRAAQKGRGCWSGSPWRGAACVSHLQVEELAGAALRQALERLERGGPLGAQQVALQGAHHAQQAALRPRHARHSLPPRGTASPDVSYCWWNMQTMRSRRLRVLGTPATACPSAAPPPLM